MNMQELLKQAVRNAVENPTPTAVVESAREIEAATAAQVRKDAYADALSILDDETLSTDESDEKVDEIIETIVSPPVSMTMEVVEEPTVIAAELAEEYEAMPEPFTHQSVNVKTLADKGVLLHLKRRMYSPYKLDVEETAKYGAGNVNKHLFEGRNNRVKEAISKYTKAYTFVNDWTIPWLDNGVRILNLEKIDYFWFMGEWRKIEDEAKAAVDDLCNNWDAEVQADLARLQSVAQAKGLPNLANPSDYPNELEVRERFGMELRFSPVPTSGDFRVDIAEESKASVDALVRDAEAKATQHVIEQMIEPMRKATDKLRVPIGNNGAVFRDSMIQNIADAAERMNKVNISNDSSVQDKINDLRSVIGQYVKNIDVLRDSPTVRQKAAQQIDTLVTQMAGLV